MIKKTLYPKTRRVKLKSKVVITEKLDGSNIGFFKVNGELLIAQRNNVFSMSELEDNIQMLYRGLKGWIDVNGENAHPLYKFLRKEAKGIFSDKIKWNFTKFLIDCLGNIIKRYAPKVKPD